MTATAARFDRAVTEWIEEYGEAQVLQAWEAAEEEEAFRSYEPHDKQVQYHELRSEKIVVIKGGNRSGKSYGAVVDMLASATNQWPDALEHLRNPNWKPIKVWVITLDYPTLREAIDEYLQKFVPAHWVEKWDAQKHTLHLKNLENPNKPGSKITFRSADAGAGKLESAAVDYALIDEECSWEVFHAVYTRTISTKGLIRIAMTPTNGYSWSYKRLWLKRAGQVGGKKYIRFINVSMYDNPHLDPEEIEMAEDIYEDEVLKAIRIHGDYAEISGEMVFNAYALTRMKKSIRQPIENHDSIDIWERPMPGHHYVIGADSASGVADGDYSCGVVLNVTTQKVVAMMRQRLQPDEFGQKLVYLGRAYNNAKVAVERQAHGTSVLIKMRDLGYYNLYCHNQEDRVSRSTPSNLLGWNTTAQTKDEMIDLLRETIGTRKLPTTIDVPSERIIDELFAFVYYTDKLPTGRSQHKLVGRCGAKQGTHDDTVIALAIAGRVSKTVTIYQEDDVNLPQNRPGTVAHLLQEIEDQYEAEMEERGPVPGTLSVTSGDHLHVA